MLFCVTREKVHSKRYGLTWGLLLFRVVFLSTTVEYGF